MEGGLAGSAFAAGSLSPEARYVVLTGQGPERAKGCDGWKDTVIGRTFRSSGGVAVPRL
jgi:hypothetical protein